MEELEEDTELANALGYLQLGDGVEDDTNMLEEEEEEEDIMEET